MTENLVSEDASPSTPASVGPNFDQPPQRTNEPTGRSRAASDLFLLKFVHLLLSPEQVEKDIPNSVEEDASVEEEVFTALNGSDQTESRREDPSPAPDNSAQGTRHQQEARPGADLRSERDNSSHGGDRARPKRKKHRVPYSGCQDGTHPPRSVLSNLGQQHGYPVTYEESSRGALDSPTWSSVVFVNGIEYGRGTGPKRGAARDKAATAALHALGIAAV
ncbi:hypothetical protein R3P38DRAFT_2761162 [Favolaschia claudopus]|uniref:DRBM domain-containing protein n=1 Tax=Favolaschia claudopus TaxID=2862362 RepID=A0AAW0DZV8_9AGAR